VACTDGVVYNDEEEIPEISSDFENVLNCSIKPENCSTREPYMKTLGVMD
jgi:hypothetical protein